MFGITPLVPAYGRDYTSKAKAQADFDAGKDFCCNNGRYCSKSDFNKDQKIQCRSANLRKIWILTA